MEPLFESRPEIARVAGNLKVVQAVPEILPEPVLRPDPAQQEFLVQCYGTVLRDGGQYRMWYSSFRKLPSGFDGKEQCYCGYAESDDGLTWRRPRVGLVEIAGSREHNVCDLGVASISVFIDPEGPASHRYRAQGYAQADYVGTCLQPGMRPGYYTLHSADGLKWERDQDTPTWEIFSDDIMGFYHPQQRRGVVMLKREWLTGGIRRRGFWESEFRNGTYGPDRSALVPDEFDDITARTRGYISGDYYHMGFMPAGKSTIGFLAQFRHDPPHHPANPVGVLGDVDLSLVYQLGPQDRWYHVWGRQDFIAHGGRPWMAHCVYPSTCAAEMGTHQGLFFSGATVTHGYGFKCVPNGITYSDRFKEYPQNEWANIGLARWPKDRLLGFRSDAGGTMDLNLGTQTEAVEMALNCETIPTGRIHAEIIGPDRKPAASSQPIVGDHACAVLRWGDTTRIPVQAGPLTLRLHIECAAVYGFELRAL